MKKIWLPIIFMAIPISSIACPSNEKIKEWQLDYKKIEEATYAFAPGSFEKLHQAACTNQQQIHYYQEINCPSNTVKQLELLNKKYVDLKKIMLLDPAYQRISKSFGSCEK